MDYVLRRLKFPVFFVLLFIAASFFVSAQPSLLDPTSSGFGGMTRGQNYDHLLDTLYSNSNVVTTMGDELWVPWYSRSDRCSAFDLKSGSSCNAGMTIDLTHNCMVTDEFSQVGVLTAMGRDQVRMDWFFNTVLDIKSKYGSIPAWRVFRNGDAIEACRSGVNGNCDTASDATARIMIALFTASENPLFPNEGTKAKYDSLARQLAKDFLHYEVLYECRPSSLGYGDICYWLAAGSGAKSGGLASTDFGYTGYYADAIIAMLQACAQTGNQTYCQVAKDFTLNYLQAARYDGASFTVPPGRSFKWVNSFGNVPLAQCTSGCSPDKWDDADAPRAFGMCQANYYAQLMGVTLPGLDGYCDVWGQQFMTKPTSTVVQYYANGAAAVSAQSGFFAQGLEALYQIGGHDPSLFQPTLDSALGHYSPLTKTWDYQSCFGVYQQAFAIRALGVGIGRDELSFISPATFPQEPVPNESIPTPTPQPVPSDSLPNSTTSTSGAASLPVVFSVIPSLSAGSSLLLAPLVPTCTADGKMCSKTADIVTAACRYVEFSTLWGPIRMSACLKQAGIEIYRNSYPSGYGFSACFDTSCVDDLTGFARLFISTQETCAPAEETCDGKDNDCDGFIDENGICATVPVNPGVGELAGLSTSCTVSGQPVLPKEDTNTGSCRALTYSTPAGDLKVLGCRKFDGTVELYCQNSPAGVDFSVCLDAGCVSDSQGFAKFSPTGGAAVANTAGTPAGSSSLALDVAGLPLSVTPAGTKTSDTLEPSGCRRVIYDTSLGRLDARICPKTDHYETYLLASPGATLCSGDNCVGPSSGFCSFT
jgi:hypothetical protein